MRDLSLHLMDIIQNSITAGASQIRVSVMVDDLKEKLKISVLDNGCGMSKDFLETVLDPFTTKRTTRKVGLGISMLKESSNRANGHMGILSKLNFGTKISASFQIDSIDRLPIGDISKTISYNILANPQIEFELKLKSSNGKFIFKTKDIKEKLGEVSINDMNIILWIEEYIKEEFENVFEGILQEI